jgi:hypothetical protein
MEKAVQIVHEWITAGNIEAELDLSGLGLNYIISLPSSVKRLNVSSNNLTELLILPVSLKELKCANNKIKKLRLPSSLETLSCENNELPLYPISGESLVSYNMRLMTA